MKSKPIELHSILLDETAFCASGKLPKSDHPTQDQKVFEARLVSWNARKSEVLLLEGDCHPLQKVRTLMSRGNLAEAEAILETLLRESGTPAELVEVLLEKARFHSFQGDWSQCRVLCDQGLDFKPTGVTCMALHSVKSVALFELGEFEHALRCLDKLEGFYELYPHTVFEFYSSAVRIRILARAEGWAAGKHALKAASREMVLNKNINPDRLLTLLRIEVDLAAIEDRNFSAIALGALWLAEKMGDRLYRDLSELDYRVAMGDISGTSSEFVRIRKLMGEILSDGGSDTTGRTLHKVLRSVVAPADPIAIPRAPNTLVLSDLRIAVNLNTLEIISAPTATRLFDALHIMSHGPVTKAELFQKLWFPQKYAAHLHDPLIRVLLSRLRRELKLEVESSSGLISLSETLVI